MLKLLTGWKGYAAICLIGIILGWQVQGWRKDNQITQIELKHGETVTQQLIQNLAKAAEYRQLERDLATALTRVSGYYQERLTDVEQDKNHFIAGVRAGTIKLRDPYRPSSRAGGGITAEAISTASGRDAETGCELSPEASEFLYSEAARADKVVEQLGACQGVVMEYLKFLGDSS